MIRFDTFYTRVKAIVAPENIGENQIPILRSAIMNGLIAVQTDIKCYRDFHVDFITKSYVRDFCNTDIFTGPRGVILQVYAYKPGKDCTKYFYTRKSTEFIQCWIDEQRCVSDTCSSNDTAAIYDSPYCHYPIAGTEGCLPPYLNGVEDDSWFIGGDWGCGECSGDGERYFAVGQDYQVFLAPRFPCGYVVAVQWEGIKRTWTDPDPVFDDEDLKMAVAKYAEAELSAKDRKWEDVAGLRAGFKDLCISMAQRCRQERRLQPPRDCSPMVDHLLPMVNPAPDTVSLSVYGDGTPGELPSPLAPSPNIVSINTNNTLWVDQDFGNDGIAMRERMDRPYRTLTAAKNAAQSGDLVHVRPGTFTENNLMKAGVNWYFEQGAIINYTDPGYIGTSTTTLTIGNGVQTLTVQAGLNLSAGDPVFIALTPLTTDPDAGGQDYVFLRMGGTVTSYSGTTLVANITQHSSPGYVGSNWLIFGPSWAVFDDRTAGAAGDVSVGGFLELNYRLSNPYNLNASGSVVIQSASTNLNWKSLKSTIAAPTAFGGNTAYGMFSIQNCETCYIDIDSISDTFETWSDLMSAGNESYGPGGGTGFYWGTGETHINCRRNTMAFGYPLWCEEPVGGVASNLYYKGQLLSSTAISGFYVSSNSSSYRSWVTCDLIESTALALSLLGPAKIYVTAQKISSTAGQTIDTSCEAWIISEKISSTGSWLNTITRQCHVTCQHWESIGSNGGGITVSSGSLFLHGGYFKTGSQAVNLLTHTAGTTKARGCYFDGSANNVAGNRVLTVAAAGLALQGCTIIAPAAGESIYAAAALKDVRLNGYNVATKAAHANINLLPAPGYLIIDANAAT